MVNRINITEEERKWLAKGTLVHIHGNKHGPYKTEIMQSIFVIEFKPKDVEFYVGDPPKIFVLKTIKHEKDRTDKRLAVKILMGRLIKHIIKTGNGIVFIPKNWEDIEDWITLCRPPDRPLIMVVDPSIKSYDEVRDMVKRCKDDENTMPAHL